MPTTYPTEIAREVSQPNRYAVCTKSTPGAVMTVQSRHANIAEARKAASTYDHRRDLTYQDVRIDRANGTLVEYAGPAR